MDEHIKKQIMEWDSLCKEESDFYHRAAVRSGLPDVAYWVIYSVCWRETPVSQSELCAENYFPKQTVHSAVAKLVSLGLVRLDAKEDSRKRKLIELTPSGETFCEQYVRPILQVESDALEEMDRGEVEQMLATMKKQLTLMKEKAEKLWQ